MIVLSRVPNATRFAPSPTGFLHLGHAYAALTAARKAQELGAAFHLRIEDIDRGRYRPEFEQAIKEDLSWLGLNWETPVMRQSERFDIYEAALAQLSERSLLYPCFCTRKIIKAEIKRANAAPHAEFMGPDGILYPGTCRGISATERADLIASGKSYALRLDMSKAIASTKRLVWHDEDQSEVLARPDIFGDIILARKDVPTSYHLAVTVDDHAQGITLVTRGQDLFSATHIQRLLQALLDLNTPKYLHHPLIVGTDGKKFSKRDGSATLRQLRADGVTPENICKRIGLIPAE
jgi:glutamyl-Q tRNA(Asp) synthetase